MSLIERAAGRIAESARDLIPKPTPAEAFPAASSPGNETAIERAAAKLNQHMPGAPSAPVVANPAYAAPPSMLELTKSRREPTMAEVSPQGMINLARLKQAGLITPDGERSTIAEEFRQIKRPLLMNAFNQGVAQVKNGNLIMVTSSLPGEGKSGICAIFRGSAVVNRCGRRLEPGLVTRRRRSGRAVDCTGLENRRG